MLIEYLFEINPFTLALIMASIIMAVYKSTLKQPQKIKKIYDDVPQDWITLDNNQDPSNTISVMSYNIMAYNFTKTEWFPYCSHDLLHPKYRAPRILNEIEKLNADIVCLQECDHDLFLEFYKVNLEDMGYTTLYKISSTNRIVTNVIAFKSSQFRQDNFELLDLNEGLQAHDDSFTKHKECLILSLRHLTSNKLFIVANTHLFWNPDYEYVKYGQLSKILCFLEQKYNKLPLILCGDMNSTPSSNVLKYVYKLPPTFSSNIRGDPVKNKQFQEMFFKDNLHKMNIRSAYDVYKGSNKSEFADNHPDFTTYTHEFIGNLDYILYSEGNVAVTSLLRVPTDDDVIKSSKLPNQKFPSDHLKIAAKFRFVN